MNHSLTDPTAAIVGDTPAIAELRRQITRLAGFDAVRSPHVPSVLICGETGTGKGLIARTLHDAGPRAAGPFIDVNCAAIPETMLEAELFGFEEGAFTDAKRAKPGLFEAAAGGSLFLDEIDSCSLTLQSKLLKAIEEKSVRRLGAVSSQPVDIKLIAASQRNLADLAAAGTFRSDLYHRLAVVVLLLPTLRERAGDVGPLAEHYLRRYAEAHGLVPKTLTADGASWLANHDWPGNVRELSHLMERVTLLVSEDTVDGPTLAELRVPVATTAAAPAAVSAAAPAVDTPGEAPAGDDPAEQIRSALRSSGGNVARAARILGIGRNALRYRMRRYGIAKPSNEELAQAPAPPAPPAEPASDERTTEPAAHPADPPPPPTAPSWEERTAAVLAIEIVMPSDSGAGVRSDPWTIARKWRDQIIVDRVQGFGGTFLQSTPSRLTAVFGVPKALEQSPQRAVQSGLAILRHAKEEASRGRDTPELRLAVHLGTVQFDINASNLAEALLPTGDTLALPERLLGHAANGEILVSPHVARRVARSFELSERAVQLGGDSSSVEAHAVVAPRRTSDAKEAPSAEGRFVGRQRELDLLRESFERAATGSGQAVFVVGDAGMGKSRLLREFRTSIAEHHHVWVEGRCASYGSATAFLPIVDACRRYFGIEDRDDETTALAKVESKLTELGSDMQWTQPFVTSVLSMAADESVAMLDSASRRSETFGALKAIILRESERQPLVICVEDLHWIDPASEEFLIFLAETIPTANAMLVCSYRPGYRQPFGDRSYHLQLGLSALSRRETAEVAVSTLGVEALPVDVEGLITGKAEGNPFYIEEISASLLEDGSLQKQNGQVSLSRRREEIDVPDTIQDVLIARIDRLADESRRAIQVASVIGREFALRLLERITESGDRIRGQIDELRTLELIYEKGMHPELAYMFKHALTHDVAYHSVHRDRRRSLHQVIGLAIEELYDDRLAEHYETLAHHFSEGRDWQRALDYHAKAADKAAEGHANRSVVHHCRKALEIAATMGESVPDPTVCGLEDRLGLALFHLSEFDESGKAYERAAARAGDAAARSLLLSSGCLSFFWAHDYDNARRLLGAASELSKSNGDKAGLACVEYLTGTYLGIIEADLEGFEEKCTVGTALEVESGADIAAGLGCFAKATLYEWTARYDECIETAKRGIAIGKKLRLSHLSIMPMWFGAKALCCTGNYGPGLAQLHEAFEICDRIGDRAWRSRLLNTIGWCHAELGDHQGAVGFNERASEIARELGDPEIMSNSEINLVLNHLSHGELEEAEARLQPILDDLANSTDPWMRWRFSLHALNARALVLIEKGELDSALALADDQIRGASQHNAPKIESRAETLRGELLMEMDRREDARQAILRSEELARRICYQRGIGRALQVGAEVDRRDGSGARADEKRSQARSIIAASAETLASTDLKKSFLAQFG